MGMSAVRVFAVAILIAVSMSCAETSVTTYETAEAARLQGVFSRGWVPDVLPTRAGPLTEAHNVDTNARCAFAQFSPSEFEAVAAALSKEGFERHEGPVLPAPLRECTFTAGDAGGVSLQLRRRAAAGQLEFAAIDRVGRFYYWSARR